MSHVSVIIPTFNRGERLVRTISSVLDQTFRDFELIVVDDGSNDDTSETLSQYREKIHVIYHDKNLGVSAARNSGIKASESPLIAFLDSDDYWMPKKLEAQVKFFRENPNALICQTEEVWIRNGIRVNPRKKHRKPSGDIFEKSLNLCLVSPSAVMLKRSLFTEIGLFNEELPVCEDYDLWLRISSKYPVHLIDETLIVKQGGSPDQLSSSLEGMDRFRIKSMLDLLENCPLNSDQIKIVHRELALKCRIYGEGCIKRGKIEEGNYYFRIIEALQ